MKQLMAMVLMGLIIMSPFAYSAFQIASPSVIWTDSNDDCGSGLTQDWSNPDYALVEDGSSTTYSLDSGGGDPNTKCINSTGFNFSLPANSRVKGITATGKISASGGVGVDNLIKMVVGMNRVGTNQTKGMSSTYETTDTNRIWGSSTNLWGYYSLNSSKVNSNQFGFSISSSLSIEPATSTISLDYMGLKVDYNVAPTTIVDYNNAWQETDANITMTCVAGDYACWQTYYRVSGYNPNQTDYSKMWITVKDSNAVKRIDLATNAVDMNIGLKGSPRDLMIAQDGNIWVTNQGIGTVSRINPYSGLIDLNIAVNFSPNYFPKGITQCPDGNIYVASTSSGNTTKNVGSVSRINPNTLVVDKNWGLNNPQAIVCDQNNAVWVTNSYFSDTSGNLITRLDPISGLADVNVNMGTYTPRGLAIDNNKILWVAINSLSTIGFGKVDTRNNTLLATYDIGSGTARGVGVDANNNVWISISGSANLLYKFSPTLGAIIATYGIGSDGYGVGIDANQNVWVVRGSGGVVSRLNQNGAVDLNIQVGTQPNTPSGQFTGFHSQFFNTTKGTLANGYNDLNGWRMIGGNNDSNILFTADGNYKLDFYSIDINGNMGDLNTVYVLIGSGSDPCSPTINQDWNISTSISCTGKTINLGTGRLVIELTGDLNLQTSTVTASELIAKGNGTLKQKIRIFSGSNLKIK